MENLNVIFSIFLIEIVVDVLVLNFYRIKYNKLFLIFLQVPKLCAVILCLVCIDKLWLGIILCFISKIIWLLFVTDSFKINRMFSIIFFQIFILFSILGFAWFICLWLNVELKEIFKSKIAAKYNYLVLFGLFLYIFAFFKFVRITEKNKYLRRHLAKVSFKLFDKHISFNGLIDSGNCVIDDITQKPVIILSLFTLKRFLSQEEIDWLFEFKIRNIRCETIGNQNFEMPVFRCDNLKIFKNNVEQSVSCMIGLVEKKFDNGKFDCLIHRDFM